MTTNNRHRLGMLEGILIKAAMVATAIVTPCAMTSCDRGQDNTPPRAIATATPQKGEAPSTIRYTSNQSIPGNAPIVENIWDPLGDEHPYSQTRSTPNSTFGQFDWDMVLPGDYPTRLTVVDANGSRSTTTILVRMGYGGDKTGALTFTRSELETRSYTCESDVQLQVFSTKYGQVFPLTADIKATSSNETKYFIYDGTALSDVEREVISETRTGYTIDIIRRDDSPNDIKGKL